MLLIAAIALIVVYYFFAFPKEALSNTRVVVRKADCNNCKVWNNRDASAQCDKACAIHHPDKNARFGGAWKKTENGVTCSCTFVGQHQKVFVGCGSAKSLGSKDCFFWNNKEANQNCQMVCDKYLPNKHAKWTGKWKNTTASTSACECELYD